MHVTCLKGILIFQLYTRFEIIEKKKLWENPTSPLKTIPSFFSSFTICFVPPLAMTTESGRLRVKRAENRLIWLEWRHMDWEPWTQVPQIPSSGTLLMRSKHKITWVYYVSLPLTQRPFLSVTQYLPSPSGRVNSHSAAVLWDSFLNSVLLSGLLISVTPCNQADICSTLITSFLSDKFCGFVPDVIGVMFGTFLYLCEKDSIITVELEKSEVGQHMYPLVQLPA